MSKNNKELKDNELEAVNGGMKVVAEEEKVEEQSWWITLVNFFFKTKTN